MPAGNEAKGKAATALYEQIIKELAIVSAEERGSEQDWRIAKLTELAHAYALVAEAPPARGS